MPFRRGILLVTILFIFLLLYSWIVVMLAGLRHDLKLISHADSRAQARSLARGGVSHALEQLKATSGGWQSAHLVPENTPLQAALARAETVLRAGLPPVQAWIESTPDPSVFRIKGHCRVGSTHEVVGLTVWRAQVQPQVVYALEPLETGPDSLYRLPSGGAWSLLPPPLAMFWRGAQPQVLLPNLAARLAFPCADSSGGLYAVALLDIALPPEVPSPEALYRYDGTWALLPGPPREDWTPAGLPRPAAPGDRNPMITSTAWGNKTLYACLRGNAVYALDDPAGTASSYDLARGSWSVKTGAWRKLPFAPTVWFNGDGQLGRVAPSQAADQLHDLSVDPTGRLYARKSTTGRPDTLYCWDEDAWEVIPPPPARGMANESGEWRMRELGGTPPDLESLTVDAEGNVYTLWDRSPEPDTLYKFVRSNEASVSSGGIRLVQGVWKALAVGPRQGYDKSGSLRPIPPGWSADFVGMAVTSQGDMILNLSVEGQDTLYSYTLGNHGQAVHDVLPPIPSLRALPDPAEPELYRAVTLPGVVQSVQRIAGGGQPGPPRLEYTPVSWF